MKHSFCFYSKLLLLTFTLFVLIGSFSARADVKVSVGLGVGGCPPPYYYGHGPRPWYYHNRPYCDYPYPPPSVVYYRPAPSYVYVEQPAPSPIIVTSTTSTTSSSTSSVANGSTTVTPTTSTPYGVRLSPSKVRSPYTNFTIDTHSPSGTVIYDANTGQPFLVP